MLTHRTALAVLLFSVSACATDTSPEAVAEREQARADQVFANDVRRGEEIDRVCFTRSIDSFGETTRRAVVIREGRDHYLVETFGGCFDLDWAQSLAIDSFSSCLTKGDRISPLTAPSGSISPILGSLAASKRSMNGIATLKR